MNALLVLISVILMPNAQTMQEVLHVLATMDTLELEQVGVVKVQVSLDIFPYLV